jgi:nitrogen fixation protein FixH
MLQSLFALPVVAVVEAAVFLMVYFFTPMGGRTTALLVAFLALTVLYGVSFVNWPGLDVLSMYTAVVLVTASLLAIISSVREKRRSQGNISGTWFHWGPMVLIVFFLVLFAADSLFIFVSRDGLPQPLTRWLLSDPEKKTTIRSAFPGTVHRDLQKKEALYNAYLDQVKLQQKLGWKIKKGWLGRPVVDRETVFQVAVTDKQGEPVSGALISGLYRRPSDSRLDQTFQMRETDIGVYQVSLVMSDPGKWDLTLYIQRGEQRHELHAKTSVDVAQE